MSELSDWDKAAANNNSTPPDGWPENSMQYSEVNDTAREGMAVHARFYQDNNGSLTTGGVADAYTITLNSAHTAYFLGLSIVAVFHATNTGPCTMDANGIGPANILDRGGNPLSANEITAGGIYTLRHDGVNYQLMGTPAGTVSAVSGVFTQTDAPDLVDTDVALLVGAADPATALHTELGPQQIQAKSNATATASLLLNSLGGDVVLGAQSGTGEVVMYRNGFMRATTAAGGVFRIFSEDSLDASSVVLNLSGLGGTPNRGIYGYQGSPDLQNSNFLEGGRFIIKVTKTGGGTVNAVLADPDGGTDLYYNGAAKFKTITSGVEVRGDIGVATPPTNESIQCSVALYDSNGSDVVGLLGFNATNTLLINNSMHGGAVSLQGEDASGTPVVLITADPDGDATMYHAGLARLTASAGGIVTLRSDGNTDSEARHLLLTHQNGSVRGLCGYNGGDELDIKNNIDGANVRLIGDDTGGAQKSILVGNPDGATTLFYAGINRLATLVGGTVSLRSDGNTDTENRYLVLAHQNGAERGKVGFAGSSNLAVENDIHGGQVVLRAEDTGGTLRNLVVGDPDGDTALYDSGISVARTLPAASGGFEVNNTTTGAGFERVLTVGDLGTVGNALIQANTAVASTVSYTSDTSLNTLVGIDSFSSALSSATLNAYTGKVQLWTRNESGGGGNLRFELDRGGSTSGSEYGMLRIDDDGAALDVRRLVPGFTETSVPAGSVSNENLITYDFTLTPTAPVSETIAVQLAQSTSDAIATSILPGSNWQVQYFEA